MKFNLLSKLKTHADNHAGAKDTITGLQVTWLRISSIFDAFQITRLLLLAVGQMLIFPQHCFRYGDKII
jgi:hypothetical protein